MSGNISEHCLAVGYSQTAISVICGGDYAEDDHCGTFLELHMGYDNSYVSTEDVLSEVRLVTENVTVRLTLKRRFVFVWFVCLLLEPFKHSCGDVRYEYCVVCCGMYDSRACRQTNTINAKYK